MNAIELSWVATGQTEAQITGGQAETVTAAIRATLAPLTEGTERQVAAAETVRTIAVANCLQRAEEARERGVAADKIAAVENKITRLSAITSAPWWMDRRGLTAAELYKALD